MQYNNQKRSPFIGLQIYLKGTGKQPPKYEFQSASKIMFVDTYDKKKYNPYQFAEWLKQPHVVAKIKSGAELRIGSVDLENESPSKYDQSNLQRKIAFFFIDKRPTQEVDGMKPVNQSMPQQPQYKAVVQDDMDDQLPPF
jgi:hypothetical protein